MVPLLSAQQMKSADAYAVNSIGIPEAVLMEHAAIALADAVSRRFGALLPTTEGLVVAGTGNNGGDVIAAARILFSRGCRRIKVVVVGNPENRSPGCEAQLHIAQQLPVPISVGLSTEEAGQPDWILDGIFGTGLSREVAEPFRSAIEEINRRAGQTWIISADIPSGLNADTGKPMTIAVKASETVTFGFLKKGLVTAEAANHVGRLHHASIQIPQAIPTISPSAYLYEISDTASLPERLPAGHKGMYGHVYVWAGEPERLGACVLSGLAALRSGAGLVSILGLRERVNRLGNRPAELMTLAFDGEFPPPKKNDVLVMGPGMGVSEESWGNVKKALLSKWPLVLDADALTLLAHHSAESMKLMESRNDIPTVLTPHPKEASRLLECGVDEVETDRFRSMETLTTRWNAVIVLKGKGTLVGHRKRSTIVVNSGNSALSKGGCGDVLAGILASCLARTMTEADAAALAVFIHGRAAEWLSERNGEEPTFLASDIAEAFPFVFKEIELCRSSK